MKLKWTLIFFGVMLSLSAPADVGEKKVLRLTLEEAEKRFIANNFQVLAARYDIDAAEGAKIQASVYPNPNFEVGQGLYDRQSGKFLDTSAGGNTDFQITQLILLAGKHDKQIKIADYNKKISERQFEDLIRNLKAQLRSTFYKLFLKSQTVVYFDDGLQGLKKTLASVEAAFQKRSVLRSEVLRIKSLVTALQSDRVDALADIADAQSDMKTLMGMTDANDITIEPVATIDDINNMTLTKPFEEVLSLSLKTRPDLQILDEQVKQEETNLDLQKAMSIPDFTVGMQYSKQGSYIRDYTAITLGFNIPIFDINQGNIKSSKAQLESKKFLKQHGYMDHEHDLQASFQKAQDAEQACDSLDVNFLSEYKDLTQKMLVNYERKNIGIIAFADFYESFRSSVLQLSALQLKKVTSFEDLNLRAGQIVTEFKKQRGQNEK